MSAGTVATETRSPREPTTRRSRRLRGRWRGAVYAVPTAVFVLLLFVLPLILVFQMSASNWPLLGGNQGLNFPKNYVDAFSNRFLTNALIFTVTYTVVTTVILLALALGLALLVQESSRWKGVLRTAILIPSALGLASASLLFYVLYSPLAGPFADLMNSWGITFLGTPSGALWSTVFLIVWRYAGFYMLLMLVGLQAIPEDVYEAARIDGAGRMQTFRSITLPCCGRRSHSQPCSV
ncbi:carbohydrate ABC transporter permease [Leifsonia poae]|uniref:carbohydrate ABC transporter permease n=1 Tax=Leifsonia poae TaxID=110933 RepID=UPI003D67B70E